MKASNEHKARRAWLVVGAIFASASLLADTQNWSASPASAEWSTTAANWEGGAVWTPTNMAVFGESTQKAIQIPEDVVVKDVVVNADGYTFSGEGAVATPEHGWSSSTTQYQSVDVAEGVTAHVDVPIAGSSNSGVLTKKGAGTLVVSGDINFLRVLADAGTLVVSNCLIEAAKIHDEVPSSKSHLVLDGVTIRPMNNNVILGDIDKVSLGAGGVLLTNNLRVTLTNIRIKQSIGTRPDLAGAVDGGIVHDAPYNLYIDSVQNTFSGGFFFNQGSNFLAHDAGLGYGPVTLKSPLYAMNAMTITNDVVIYDGGVLGVSNSTVTLSVKNPSFAAGKSDGIVTLASVDGGGRVMFGSNSLPVGGYVLRNGVDLVADGNVMKVASGAQPPYVRAVNGKSRLVLGPHGGVIDTDGNDIALGVPLVSETSATTNVSEITTAFSNYSFEDASTTGWTFGAGKAGSGGRYANSSGFVSNNPTYQTPYGSYFAVARSGGGTLEKNFTVESDGMYRIVFDYACRPGYDTDGQLQFALYLNHGEEDEVVLRPMTAVGSNHPFERYETDFVTLVAGKTYSFKMLTGDYIDRQYGYDCFLVDRVRLERIDSVVTATGSLTKRGAGTLSVDELAPGVPTTVEAGTLAVYARAFESNVVNVANGATLAFVNQTGTVSNASFEKDSESSSSAYTGSGVVAGWTMTNFVGTSKSGWQSNGSAMSTTKPWTTNGTHTVYLRSTTRIETSVTVERAGEYELSFEYASRFSNDSSGYGYLLKITAFVDGSEVAVIPPRTANRDTFTRVSARVSLTAGTHVLRFETDDGGGDPRLASGSMVFIDAVSLVFAENVVDNGSVWNFERGATVDLCGNNVTLGTAMVDGKVVTGGRSQFVAAGLNVVGRGKLRSGPPPGIMIIVH